MQLKLHANKKLLFIMFINFYFNIQPSAMPNIITCFPMYETIKSCTMQCSSLLCQTLLPAVYKYTPSRETIQPYIPHILAATIITIGYIKIINKLNSINKEIKISSKTTQDMINNLHRSISILEHNQFLFTNGVCIAMGSVSKEILQHQKRIIHSNREILIKQDTILKLLKSAK